MFACNSLAHAPAAGVQSAECFFRLFSDFVVDWTLNENILYGNRVRAGKSRRSGKKSN